MILFCSFFSLLWEGLGLGMVNKKFHCILISKTLLILRNSKSDIFKNTRFSSPP